MCKVNFLAISSFTLLPHFLNISKCEWTVSGTTVTMSASYSTVWTVYYSLCWCLILLYYYAISASSYKFVHFYKICKNSIVCSMSFTNPASANWRQSHWDLAELLTGKQKCVFMMLKIQEAQQMGLRVSMIYMCKCTFLEIC